MGSLPDALLRQVEGIPEVYRDRLLRAFEDLERSYAAILESEAIIQERKRRYLARTMDRAHTDKRLRTKTNEELSVIAFLETMRDSRTAEDIGDQNWMHTRIATLRNYIDAVLSMYRAGLLPKDSRD